MLSGFEEFLDPCCSRSTLSDLQLFDHCWEDASFSVRCLEDSGTPEKAGCDCSSEIELLAPCFPHDLTVGVEERSVVEETGLLQQCHLAVSAKHFGPPLEEDPQTIVECGDEGSRFRHRFPPPITSCATRSIRKDGRFVLKEVNARPYTFFQARRENGRLRLLLVQPMLGDDDGEHGSEDEWNDLTSEVSDDQTPPDEAWRSSVDTIGIVSELSEKSPDLKCATSIGEILCPTSSAEIESGVCKSSNERVEAVSSYGGNDLVNRFVETVQIENPQGLGVQGTKQSSGAWRMGETNLNMWPTSQIFLPHPLTRASPVMGC